MSLAFGSKMNETDDTFQGSTTSATRQVFTYKDSTPLEERLDFEVLWENYFKNAKAGYSWNSPRDLVERLDYLEEDAYPFLQLFLRRSARPHELREYVDSLISEIELEQDKPSHLYEYWISDNQQELDMIKAFLESNDVMRLAESYSYFLSLPRGIADKELDPLTRILKNIDYQIEKYKQNDPTKLPSHGDKIKDRVVSFWTMLESMVMAHQAAEAIIQEFNKHNTTQIPAQWLNTLTFGLFNWLYQVVDKLRDRINPSRVTLRLLKQELLDTAVAEIKSEMKKPVTSKAELSSMFSALATMTDRFAFANVYLQVKAKTVAIQYAAVKDVKAAEDLPSDPFNAIRDQAKDVLYHGETDAFHDLKEKDKNIGSIVKEENAWGNTVREKHLARPLNKK